jgi:beta-glucanase (GH16 family)
VEGQLFAYPNGWKDTEGNGEYYPSQVLSIHNDELDFYLHENSSGEPLVSAVEPKIPGSTDGDGLLYGAYAVRFRATSTVGYKTAWLLWPDSEKWPQDGEVDFPEGDMNGGFWAFMHWRGGTNGFDKYAYNTGDRFDKWQTALIEWTPQMVRFILNGKIIGTSTQHIPDTPMHWVLQTETATDGTIPAASTAGHVDVAWVSVYRTHESALRKLRRVER